MFYVSFLEQTSWRQRFEYHKNVLGKEDGYHLRPLTNRLVSRNVTTPKLVVNLISLKFQYVTRVHNETKSGSYEST